MRNHRGLDCNSNDPGLLRPLPEPEIRIWWNALSCTERGWVHWPRIFSTLCKAFLCAISDVLFVARCISPHLFLMYHSSQYTFTVSLSFQLHLTIIMLQLSLISTVLLNFRFYVQEAVDPKRDVNPLSIFESRHNPQSKGKGKWWRFGMINRRDWQVFLLLDKRVVFTELWTDFKPTDRCWLDQLLSDSFVVQYATCDEYGYLNLRFEAILQKRIIPDWVMTIGRHYLTKLLSARFFCGCRILEPELMHDYACRNVHRHRKPRSLQSLITT